MAAKRLPPEEVGDGAKEAEMSAGAGKRMRATAPSSFLTGFSEMRAVKSPHNLLAAILEPLFRKVVKEEVERGLLLLQAATTLERCPLKQIQPAAEDDGSAAGLKLVFGGKLAKTLFTGSMIEDEEENPLRLHLVVVGAGGQDLTTVVPPSPLRVEIVAVDGDFPGDREDWTSGDFDRKIVKEREGKRPLLTGDDAHLTLRDAGSCTVGDLTFTDNSSWIRCRHFRLGARVVPGSCPGLRVKPGMTEPFMVKDHRGELYRKHFPPALDDDVWRLKSIAKGGAFHKKLQREGIRNVQDLMKLFVVDPDRLRAVLGPGLPEKIWEVIVGHAKTCQSGNKLYVHRRHRYVVFFNPVCEVEAVVVDGNACPVENLLKPERDAVQQMVWEAYAHWDKLEEVDKTFGLAALKQQQQRGRLNMPQITMGSSSSSTLICQAKQLGDEGLDIEDLLEGEVQLDFSGTWFR